MSPDPDRASRAPVGAVLAGGAGSRMDGEKAGADLAGRALLHHPLRAIDQAGLEAIVVAKEASALPALRCRVLLEDDEPQHPLTGILAALEHAAGRAVIALGCDMPFVTGTLVGWLAQLPGPAVPRVDGRLQPFPARYEPGQVAALNEALRGDESLTGAVAATGPRIIEEAELARFGDPCRLVSSVNTPEELASARSAFSG